MTKMCFRTRSRRRGEKRSPGSSSSSLVTSRTQCVTRRCLCVYYYPCAPMFTMPVSLFHANAPFFPVPHPLLPLFFSCIFRRKVAPSLSDTHAGTTTAAAAHDDDADTHTASVTSTSWLLFRFLICHPISSLTHLFSPSPPCHLGGKG